MLRLAHAILLVIREHARVDGVPLEGEFEASTWQGWLKVAWRVKGKGLRC